MKFTPLFLILFLTTQCTPLLKAASGKFSHFDTNEYYQIVKVQADIQESKTMCANKPQMVYNQLVKIEQQLGILNLYASGRPDNQPTIEQIELLKNEVTKTKTELGKDGFLKKFCEFQFENLEEIADILRKSSGGKPQ